MPAWGAKGAKSQLATSPIELRLSLCKQLTPGNAGGSAVQVILGPDPQLALYGELVVWFHKVELFRHEEEQRMFRQTPGPEDLNLHKNPLLRLIADGEHLVRLIEQHGFLTNNEGVTAEDLKATLQNLRADFRGWHEPMPATQKAELLREVFDVPVQRNTNLR